MKIIDLPDPNRVKKEPTQIQTLLSSDCFSTQGIKIKKVELRLYIEHIDEKLGPFSLITSYVDTEIGSIEMIYDEGYRGEDSLNRTTRFLTSNLGLSALLLRSIIALKEHQDNTS